MTLGNSLRSIALMLVCMAATGNAQQGPPIGLPVPPLGKGPFEFDTAEKQKIRVSVVTNGLSHPWSIAFLPDGNMLVTERLAAWQVSTASRSSAHRLRPRVEPTQAV